MGTVRPQRLQLLAWVGVIVAGALTPIIAHGQAGTGTQGGFTQEWGLDATVQFGLGDQSSIQVLLPAARARIGFFQPASRWSLEPALGLNYVKFEDADGVLQYTVEAGALWHFRPAGDLRAMGATVAYVRPFVALAGVTGDEGEEQFSVGGGFGVKIPWQGSLAWRLEANVGYGFDTEAFVLGAFAGVSFFTNR